MTDADRRAALSALEAARPTIAALDPTRRPEETAADLVEVWTAVETALRSLAGGSALAGQALIRELRQQQVISLEQAHAVLELLAVRERVDRPDYQPTAADDAVARETFATLDRTLHAAEDATTTQPVQPPAAGDAPVTTAAAPIPASELQPAPGASSGRILMVVLIILALILAGGGYYWYTSSGPGGPLARGIADYGAGRREQARMELQRAVSASPNAALPHIYLARIARDEGDFAGAGRELTTAVQLDPKSALAQRELGALFLARGAQFATQQRTDLAAQDYDAARRAYVRAIQLDPGDTTAYGWLGCALVHLGRAQEAASWFQRAGQGPWSVCNPAASGAAPLAP